MGATGDNGQPRMANRSIFQGGAVQVDVSRIRTVKRHPPFTRYSTRRTVNYSSESEIWLNNWTFFLEIIEIWECDLIWDLSVTDRKTRRLTRYFTFLRCLFCVCCYVGVLMYVVWFGVSIGNRAVSCSKCWSPGGATGANSGSFASATAEGEKTGRWGCCFEEYHTDFMCKHFSSVKYTTRSYKRWTLSLCLLFFFQVTTQLRYIEDSEPIVPSRWVT